jgi:hypothetical protein
MGTSFGDVIGSETKFERCSEHFDSVVYGSVHCV